MAETSTAAAPAASPRRWWILLAIGVGTFMAALDGSVVNVVLPLLRRDLNTSVAGIEWVLTDEEKKKARSLVREY